TLSEALAGSGWPGKVPFYLQPAFLGMLLLTLAVLTLLVRVVRELRRKSLSAPTLSGWLASALALAACLALFQPGSGGWTVLSTLSQRPGRGNVLALSSGAFLLSTTSQASSYEQGAFRLMDGREDTRWASEGAFPHEIVFAPSGEVELDQAIFTNAPGDTGAREVELLGSPGAYPPKWESLGKFPLEKSVGPQVLRIKRGTVRQVMLRILSNHGSTERTELAELELSGPVSRPVALQPVSTNLLAGGRVVALTDQDAHGAENLLAGPEGGVWRPGAEGEVVLAMPGPDEHLVGGLRLTFPAESKARTVQVWASVENPRGGFKSLGRWARAEGAASRVCLIPPTRARYLKVRVSGGESSEVLRVEAFQPPLQPGKLPAGSRTGGLLGSYYQGLRFGDHKRDQLEAVDFRWDSPPAGFPDPTYAVVWRGSLKVPETGLYRLGAAADDGFRLVLGGQTLALRWSGQSLDRPVEVPVVLAAGWYPLELWVANREGAGGARLLWAQGDQELKPVPASALAGPAASPRRTPRTAAQDGVDWLAPAAVAWQDEHRCMGCHVQGQALMGLSLATRNEYRVDPGPAARLASFVAGDVRGEKGFAFSHGDLVSSVQYVGLGLAHDRQNLDLPASESQARLARWLAERQSKDGSLHNDRVEPPIEQGDIMVTANSLLVLRQAGEFAADARLRQASARAADYLLEAVPETTQDRCHRILGLAIGRPEGAEDALRGEVSALWDLQRPDGGWSERPGLERSNGFATGQVLYALKVAGVSVSDARFQRGVKFLVDSQQVFGSWPAVDTDASRPSEYAPTMWAVIGLAGSFEAIVVDLVEPEEGQPVGLKAGEQPARAEVLNFTDEEIAAVSFSLEGKPLGEDA
ncbi:MAG: PA14 domain-containing protein, partial [Candidatus Eremiobacterota bacterium]